MIAPRPTTAAPGEAPVAATEEDESLKRPDVILTIKTIKDILIGIENHGVPGDFVPSMVAQLATNTAALISWVVQEED